ncbi:hypothetical protein TrCOL_g7582 [Triparma columacea]|uniref:Uncharacterized protein n=1 Tax=Triparma columacea TaxID=722753 RepID=A0A9W7G7K3_9STRA|nr:hypothetical protein TrCOL_g7582 [Triparma columacea]
MDFLAAQQNAIESITALSRDLQSTQVLKNQKILAEQFEVKLSRGEAEAVAAAEAVEKVRSEEEERRRSEWDAKLRDVTEAAGAERKEMSEEIKRLTKMCKKLEDEKKRMKIKFDQEMYVREKVKK